MINAISSALSGLTNATKQVTDSANKIAIAGTEEGKDVDLAEEAVKLKLSANVYKANVATLKTIDETQDELFRLFDKHV